MMRRLDLKLCATIAANTILSRSSQSWVGLFSARNVTRQAARELALLDSRGGKPIDA